MTPIRVYVLHRALTIIGIYSTRQLAQDALRVDMLRCKLLGFDVARDFGWTITEFVLDE